VFAMLQKYQDVAKRDAADTVAMTIIRKEKKPGKDQPVVETRLWPFSDSRRVKHSLG
jgi:hypothetical protein